MQQPIRLLPSKVPTQAVTNQIICLCCFCVLSAEDFSGSCCWNTPNHFWFGAAFFTWMSLQINYYFYKYLAPVHPLTMPCLPTNASHALPLSADHNLSSLSQHRYSQSPFCQIEQSICCLRLLFIRFQNVRQVVTQVLF